MEKLFEKFNLKGKISIVVGGSGQIGCETVSTLLKSGSVVINVDCFNRRKKTKNYFFYEVNVDKEDEVIEFKKKFLQKHKRLHILINHAHYKGDLKKLVPNKNFFSKLENYPTEEWHKTMNTNLNGLFFITKHFISLLMKNKNSVILNTSSSYGKVSPNKSIYGKSGINAPIGYTTSKAAIIGFTKYVAAHYGDRGLRANVILPGGIENKNQSKEFKKNYKKLTPLKRLAKKNEYSEAILFLVSDASSYMTGSEFIIDGGWTAW